MQKRMSLWDIIAWIVLALIFLWLVLKMFGIINTPYLIEYAPYFGAVYLAGWAMSSLVKATQDINSIRGNLGHLNKSFYELDKSVEIIKSNCSKCK